MKSISDMNLAEVTLAILGAAVNIPDGMYARAQHLAKEELRALLDKPSECRCKRYGKDNPHWPCQVHTEPAAQHQGEAVAEVQHGPFDDVGQPQWVRVVTLGDFDLEHIPGGTKLFMAPAEQPAPVTVVMPERMEERDPYDSESGNWNACIDEMERLNGVKP